MRADARLARGFVDVDGQLWGAVVKATGDGSKIYITSFSKVQRRNLAAARRDLKRLN